MSASPVSASSAVPSTRVARPPVDQLTRRWWQRPLAQWAARLVVVGLLAAVFLAIIGPGQVKETLPRPMALLRLLAVGVVWLAVSQLVLPRLIRRAAVRVAIVAVGVVIGMGVILYPHFVDHTVREAGPTSAAPVAAADVTGIGGPGSGTARLLRLPSGQLVVRLENLSVENAPDPRVYLVPGADRAGTDGAVDLGQLRGNKGEQNYSIPNGTAVHQPVTVLIWCRSFATPIAHATLH